jgi:hypothetical protein
MRDTLFLAGYALCQLDAFALAGVPLPWLGLLLCTAASLHRRLMPFPGLVAGLLALMLLFAASTALNASVPVPADYIAFRFINLMAFLLIVNHVALRCRDGAFDHAFARRLTDIGLAVATVALVVFVLHVVGLGDLPRNRMGTGGLDQAIVFTFESGVEAMRALGTFREPSFLAMALLLPLALALQQRRGSAAIVIAAALYFSYSLGVLLALPLALLASSLVAHGLRRQLVALLGLAMLAAAGTWLLVRLQPDNPFAERVQHLLALDLLESSRGYVYENLPSLFDNPLLGGGIGHLPYTLAAMLGSEVPVSSLNLLLSMLGSGGLVALVIAVVWLLTPNTLVLARQRRIDRRGAFWRLVPLNAFLVLYLTTFEELHVWHAVTLGLLLGLLSRAHRRAAAAPLRPVPALPLPLHTKPSR